MNITLRTFVAAFLEMLRRWQWNYCGCSSSIACPCARYLHTFSQVRLENEHIGNTDQYRVTREVPLPYSFDDVEHESDDDADEDENFARRNSWRKKPVRMPSLSRPRPTISSEETAT